MPPSCHILNVNLYRHVDILCVHLELLRCGAKQTRVFVSIPVFVIVFVFLFVFVL